MICNEFACEFYYVKGDMADDKSCTKEMDDTAEDWGMAMSRFNIEFGDRLSDHL